MADSRRVTLAAAALALGLAWTTAPGVPLYDGVGFPDEPYRFVLRPPGYQATKPPTPGVGSATARDGRSSGLTVSSAESGPQVQFYLAPGSLTAPTSTARFDVRADPQPPGASPPGLRIDGNAYRLSVTTRPAAPAVLRPQGTSWILMRAVKATPDKPGFLYRPAPGQPWQKRESTQVGNDIYVTQLAGPGDYALAFDTPTPAKPHPTRSAGPLSTPIVVLAATLALISTAVGWIRLTRRRSTTPH